MIAKASQHSIAKGEGFRIYKKTTPKICPSKKPPLNQWKGRVRVVRDTTLKLPLGGYMRLLSACSNLRPMKLAGVTMVASMLWQSRRVRKDGNSTMRLVDAAALHFVSGVGNFSNPATFVARAWGCELATPGQNFNGKTANTWHLPPWCTDGVEKVKLRLTPRQFRQWNRRHEILRECLDEANPHAAIVRKNLAVTRPGPSFDAVARRLSEPGEHEAVKHYEKHREKLNVTRDGDVQSNVSRLPESVRETLQIDGLPVAEFDVKSAHAVLLGMFYGGEAGEDWQAEKARFNEEVLRGFPSIYGAGKKWKVAFLSALNQSTRVARHASEGYRTMERMFPMLAAKLARMKSSNHKALGRRLRVTLAEIVKTMLIENDADGIPSIPVVDSAVVAMPEDLFLKHRAAFRTAWRLGVPIAKLSGTTPQIEGSNGEIFQFFV